MNNEKYLEELSEEQKEIREIVTNRQTQKVWDNVKDFFELRARLEQDGYLEPCQNSSLDQTKEALLKSFKEKYDKMFGIANKEPENLPTVQEFSETGLIVTSRNKNFVVELFPEKYSSSMVRFKVKKQKEVEIETKNFKKFLTSGWIFLPQHSNDIFHSTNGTSFSTNAGKTLTFYQPKGILKYKKGLLGVSPEIAKEFFCFFLEKLEDILEQDSLENDEKKCLQLNLESPEGSFAVTLEQIDDKTFSFVETKFPFAWKYNHFWVYKADLANSLALDLLGGRIVSSKGVQESTWSVGCVKKLFNVFEERFKKLTTSEVFKNSLEFEQIRDFGIGNATLSAKQEKSSMRPTVSLSYELNIDVDKKHLLQEIDLPRPNGASFKLDLEGEKISFLKQTLPLGTEFCTRSVTTEVANEIFDNFNILFDALRITLEDKIKEDIESFRESYITGPVEQQFTKKIKWISEEFIESLLIESEMSKRSLFLFRSVGKRVAPEDKKELFKASQIIIDIQKKYN